MNSYQRRVKERDEALAEVESLKKDLLSKITMVFRRESWLGAGEVSVGYVDNQHRFKILAKQRSERLGEAILEIRTFEWLENE